MPSPRASAAWQTPKHNAAWPPTDRDGDRGSPAGPPPFPLLLASPHPDRQVSASPHGRHVEDCGPCVSTPGCFPLDRTTARLPRLGPHPETAGCPPPQRPGQPPLRLRFAVRPRRPGRILMLASGVCACRQHDIIAPSNSKWAGAGKGGTESPKWSKSPPPPHHCRPPLWTATPPPSRIPGITFFLGQFFFWCISHRRNFSLRIVSRQHHCTLSYSATFIFLLMNDDDLYLICEAN